ncbi:DNA-binding transcriptional LysR family regulator [Endobacter medicaginis]|uniref:DNA-binding transcriptional LysR family regulator n=1 Tax=Endobacter medicaginis TaxID=1181271 RepID=A0A850NRZ9_9PROT|nr:LysR family transcriptional regulator [Endobacter medicaginis]MBB3174334.1 DNA-binding transcriptional LysR family regulator [Endobacter medicaginis]MCX5476637.1 LysR family transcriptional regulator [Endobacter medicaginis]NVN29708.1 LysR family transcriptional regulator [Endobacter medicaginis]
MRNLEALAVFIRVADMASFTRAADSLGMPKGSASLAVRKLESEIGVRLLHRTTRSVQLTEDGRAFLARAHDLLTDFDELQSMFSGDQAAIRGRLRVDLPTELARRIVMPALPTFMANHPEFVLEMSSTDRRVDLVQESFDCVLRLGPIGDETLISRPLGHLRMVNAASPEYLERHGTPQTLDDLQSQGHRMVHYTMTLGARPPGWEYPDGGAYATLPLAGNLQVNSVQTYEAAGLAGIGLIQAPLFSLQHHFHDGTLVEILPTLRPEALPVSFVVAHRRNLSRRVRIFMDWIRDVLKPYLDERVS